jgi:F-type H+-transporting ATPase subunit delta
VQDLGVSKKYARALFGAAQEKNQLLACQQGLEQLLLSTRSKTTLNDVFMHPMISLQEKQRMLHSVLGEFSTPLLEHFFVYLFQQHRFNLLPVITADFQKLFDQSKNVVAVQVSTAFPVTEKKSEELRTHLEKVFEGTVRLQARVDPELIGGFTAQSNDFILDESVKGRLEKLRQQLMSESGATDTQSATL